MSDLIAMLRDWHTDPDEVMGEAADRIEADAATIERLTAEAESFHMQYRMKCDEAHAIVRAAAAAMAKEER